MKGIALLGGPTEQWPENLSLILRQAKTMGAIIASSDRGSLFCLEMGIIPDLAVGDFDSLKKDELTKVQSKVADVRYSHPVKDLTDSELLFEALLQDYQVDELEIYGATGGRLDHFFVNIFTFLHNPLNQFCSKVKIIDKQNIIKILNPGKHNLKRQEGFNYFGVSSLSAVEGLNIKKARYLLTDYNNQFPVMFSSNEFIGDEVEISFETGRVMFIYSKDRDRFHNLQ